MVPMLFLATTFSFDNTVMLAEFQDNYWPPFALLCEIGLPLLLLIIAVLRKKRFPSETETRHSHPGCSLMRPILDVHRQLDQK